MWVEERYHGNDIAQLFSPDLIRHDDPEGAAVALGTICGRSVPMATLARVWRVRYEPLISLKELSRDYETLKRSGTSSSILANACTHFQAGQAGAGPTWIRFDRRVASLLGGIPKSLRPTISMNLIEYLSLVASGGDHELLVPFLGGFHDCAKQHYRHKD